MNKQKLSRASGEVLESKRTTFGKNVSVEKYYQDKKNYQDHTPFDVMSMVGQAKQVDRNYSKPTVGDISETEKHILSGRVDRPPLDTIMNNFAVTQRPKLKPILQTNNNHQFH